jgi:hypothetical protein
LEVCLEAGIVGDTGVGEEEALVEIMGNNDADGAVNAARNKKLAGVVGDEETVDIGTCLFLMC